MRIEELEYHSPRSLPEACRLIHHLGDDAVILGGGTDLLADLKQGLTSARHLVSLGKLVGLRKIERSDEGLWIGALVSPNMLAESEALREEFAALADAGGSMAGVQVRNLATIGGNICSAVPSADLPPSLLTVDARVRLASHEGERELSLAEFFLGPRRTALGRTEILVALIVPPLPAGTGTAYVKFQLRDASALAVVGVAARLTVKQGSIEKAAVAVGAAAPTPLLVEEAGEYLTGKKPTDENFARAADFSFQKVEPITDLRGSDEYRRELARVLTTRALKNALERVQ